jgi:hypothetical protein
MDVVHRTTSCGCEASDKRFISIPNGTTEMRTQCDGLMPKELKFIQNTPSFATCNWFVVEIPISLPMKTLYWTLTSCIGNPICVCINSVWRFNVFSTK